MEQLGEKLMCTTLELEKLKAEAMEEMKRNRDYIKQLIHLLKFAIQERDEARTQFQKLLLIKSTAAAETLTFPPAKANSSITESNSPSETYNFHSHASTPVDSLFDAVTSPEFSDINFLAVDQSSLIIDTIAKGRALPQKGKFLQTVLQAGPLLQNLLLAGPLPRWRNPPQIQPFHIPPFSPPDLQFPAKPYTQLSCGTSAQFQSTPPLMSFTNLGSSPPAMNANGYTPLAKRQRLS